MILFNLKFKPKSIKIGHYCQLDDFIFNVGTYESQLKKNLSDMCNIVMLM
jgi:hypothetical protein